MKGSSLEEQKNKKKTDADSANNQEQNTEVDMQCDTTMKLCTVAEKLPFKSACPQGLLLFYTLRD